MPNRFWQNIMQKKLAKVLNSDSTELSASSDIGQTEINKLTTNNCFFKASFTLIYSGKGAGHSLHL